MPITGLDKLQRDLRDAQQALGNLDGDLCTLRFDPHDPASIEAAIAEMEQTIDARVGRFAGNPLVAPLVAGAKDHFRQAILDKAAASRAGSGREDGE
ncbi:gp58-like family protein [Roseomonas mucosa]|uniref:gp58-like family protein n=1 Tax=Roseomonas mucosa TaxID=207340 RepID=UPI001D92C7CB|nr:gp58-like family protein [Roseomonas mucosa]MBS5905030.1 hypothetical protein [Acetobacteraceae bacterium]MCG7353295.1 gp58-like family protein [Roseomonas mucosa]